MFKPLLRTMPCLSGNFTLACKLDIYKKNSPINFDCGITEAVLMPLQNNLANKHINVSLLYDSYEYNIGGYYRSFSSIFYNENYEYDNNNIYNIDITGNPTYKNRNIDYEFGCKRNIMDSGYQFMFYAPFYINNLMSVPDEFIIHIDFDNNRYKEIHVKIFDDTSELTNYLSTYLRRYVEKIDEKCIFCLPETNQGTYYGIDIQNGGFKNVRDNVIGVIYNKQLSINDYDKIICNGFQRNKLIMRQVVPLSFMFNIEDILTGSELTYNINNPVRISGWYEKNGMKYDFYDFDTNYKDLRIKDNVNILNPSDDTNDENAVQHNNNLNYSLFEAIDDAFTNDNTVSKTYNRWCLLSTLNDDKKYITNSSDVFLDSNNNYYDTPVQYVSNSSYMIYEDNDINLDKSNNALVNNNIYSIVTETLFNEADIINETRWHNVLNNKCLVGGIQYNLNPSLHDESYIEASYYHIDKFNVFAYINPISSDTSYYCKYSIDNNNQQFNSLIPNDYAYSLFKTTADKWDDYTYFYETHHNTNILFKKLTYSYINDTYVFKDYDGNIVNDNIYIDYSKHYYLSNIYYDNTKVISSNKKSIEGYEILDDIDPLSFINCISYEYSKLSSELTEIQSVDNTHSSINDTLYNFTTQGNRRRVNIVFGSNSPAQKLKSMIDSIVVMNYSTDNAIPILNAINNGDINSRNSRIAVRRMMSDIREGISPEESSEIVNNIKNDTSYINSYFHYVPSYKSASFVSHGHFEKNNIHSDYIYCDAWNIEDYIRSWNYEHPRDKIDDNIVGWPEALKIHNVYTGFMNRAHFDKYSKRMYNYNKNSLNDITYVLMTHVDCKLHSNGSIYTTGLTHNINKIKTSYSLIKLSQYLHDNGISNDDYDKTIDRLIEQHRLYHKNTVYKLLSKTVTKIKRLYERKSRFGNNALSFILYTTNKSIIDKFEVNDIRLDEYTEKNPELYIPLSHEILWSKKSQKETYDILSSRNVKLDGLYAKYDTHDIINCNYVGDVDTANTVIKSVIKKSSDNDLTFYQYNDAEQIQSDNKLHVINKDGINYGYYYITLNLYNNAKSFAMNTNDIRNTFDIKKYSLKSLMPYITTNILDYVINMDQNAIISKNTINVIMNKTYNHDENIVEQNDSKSRHQMSRYFNDITPLLYKTSSVTPYSIKYKNENINEKHIAANDGVIYKYNDRTIEYNPNLYDNNGFGIPCIVSIDKGTYELEFVEEYEYKFYNDNKLYLLEPYFTITDKKLYTIEQIREHENNDYVINEIFKKRIMKSNHNASLNDMEILFLFNRYKVEYESYPVRKNLSGEYKLHKLKYIFTLR